MSDPIQYLFFQAEDGIRDRNVTGVQTCALPISPRTDTTRRSSSISPAVSSARIERSMCPVTPRTSRGAPSSTSRSYYFEVGDLGFGVRSEERRVGKECGSRGARGGWV